MSISYAGRRAFAATVILSVAAQAQLSYQALPPTGGDDAPNIRNTLAAIKVASQTVSPWLGATLTFPPGTYQLHRDPNLMSASEALFVIQGID